MDLVKKLGKKFHELLSEDEGILEFLYADPFVGIWFWDLSNRKTIWLNKSFIKLLGFKDDNLLEMPSSLEELLTETDFEKIGCFLDSYLSSDSKSPIKFDLSFFKKDRHPISMSCTAKVVSNKSFLLGKVQFQSKIEEKRTKRLSDFQFKRKKELSNRNQFSTRSIKAISESKEYISKYESLISAGQLGGWEYRVSTGDLWCSKEYFDLLGYDTKNIKSWQKYETQKVWTNLLHPDDVKNSLAFFGQYLKDLNGVYRQNFRMKGADGTWIWISSVGKVMTEVFDGVSSEIIIGTHINISESKRLEEELYNANQLLVKDNALLKSIINSPEEIFIFSIDSEYRYTSFSTNYKKFVKEKFGKDIYLGYKLLDIFSESQLAIFKPKIEAALRGESCEINVSIPLNSNLLTHLSNKYNPIQDEDGKIIGATAFIHDITKEKNAEIENKINEIRYTSLFSGSSEAIIIANVKTGYIVDANLKASELLGYEKSELIKMHQTQIHPPDLLEEISIQFKQIAHSKELDSIESFIMNKGGKRIPVRITSSIPFQIGEELYSAGYFKDITKSKESETNKANLLNLLKTAEMVSNTGSIDFDLVNNRILWSDEFFKILGYEPQSFAPDNDSLYNHMDSENRDEFVQWQELSMKSVGQSNLIELNILKNDGTTGAILISGISYADEFGMIYKFVAVVKDITSRKNISQKLLQQNQQLNEIAWTQSHVVRAPLARLMGLVNALQSGIVPESDKCMFMNYVQDSANELDTVIREITAKTILTQSEFLQPTPLYVI